MNAPAHNIAGNRDREGASVAPPPSTTHGLTTTIVNNIDLLRLISTGRGWATKPALAADLGHADTSNLTKVLKVLTSDGVLVGWQDMADVRLTPLGYRVLGAVDLVEGKTVLPAGFALVEHRRIVPNPENPRRDFTSPGAIDDLGALREAIREHGVRNPPEVYPAGEDGFHVLLTGERRWRCVRDLIDLGELPEDFRLLVQVKNPDAEEAVVLAMDENLQRRNLSYTEEATAYARLANDHGWTTQKIAQRFKRSPKHVSDYLRLLTLPAKTLAELEAGEITYRQARSQFQIHKPAPEPEPQLFGEPAPFDLDAEAEPEREPAPPPAKPSAEQRADQMAITLDPRLALIIAELAYKGETDPAPGYEPGWTAVSEIPSDKDSQKLIRNGVIMFRSSADGRAFGRVLLNTSGAKAWLEHNGFYSGRQARAGLILKLWTDVLGADKAGELHRARAFATPWLTMVQPAEPGSEAEPEPPPAAEPKAAPAALTSAATNAKAIAEMTRDVAERLAQWRAERDRKDQSWADKVDDLALAFTRGSTLDVMAILTVQRERMGAMGASHFMTEALAQVVKNAAAV